ncbi:MAG: molybdenum cofactor biosynthesis protein MoaE [Candidatus Cloacimonetes bacterium]|nr:molybdenum cofactor biosynthesis protein MoaE [Candidatus Cloacimonadota bacterium]
MTSSPTGTPNCRKVTGWSSSHRSREVEMFVLSKDPIDCARLSRELDLPAAGALVTFEGRVRAENEGRDVLRLEYEAYAGLAEKEAQRILDEARGRFPVLDIRCQHRIGLLEIGEVAVWVGALSGHRGEAFDACQFVIDELKQRVPIWKKEYWTDGDSGWVRCEHCAHPHGHQET